MCLCGMLAADFDSLPRSVRGEVRAFFDDNEAWLAGVLEAGRTQGEISFTGAAAAEAQVILSTLEGAMLVARSRRDVKVFDAVARRVLEGLGG